MTDSNPEVLTLEEVNEALPQVIPILERLQKLQRAIIEGEEGNGHTRVAVTARQDQLVAEAQETFNQLTSFGAMLKDMDSGLVDFYGERDGQLILLCWRLGEEPRIRFWHALEGGFTGRRPVDELIR
ncbi:MAG: hypothetical protein COV75_07390 [Candidatus Omnitrophica bacterium CG11_big_fil_rev_8_21_14_0_20_63_9]|nr:MAG: hypothetical protein COV75_07390 [Candidatus Omnitrophica bacterium CG11_big_fil_rev_8_21_14_0_20_63_9]